MTLWWLVWLLGVGASSPLASANELKQLYTRGQKAYQAQQWSMAARSFRRLLPVMARLQNKRPKGSKSFHLMTVGRCDILFHLAEIHWRQKERRASCLLHQQISSLRKTLPSDWRSWQLHPDVPRRLHASTSQLAKECVKVPAKLMFSLAPSHAVVAVQETKGAWRRIEAKTLATLSRKVTLRVEAKGYLPQIFRDVKVGQWRVKRMKVALRKKPVLRAKLPPPKPKFPKPLPPKGVSPLKTWWFWTIAGVVVVGGTTVGVVLATQQARSLEFQEGKRGSNGFSVW